MQFGFGGLWCGVGLAEDWGGGLRGGPIYANPFQSATVAAGASLSVFVAVVGLECGGGNTLVARAWG